MKIPGLNKHIFRIPDLPWGDWQDNILSLNPLLWLDSSDSNNTAVEVNAIADKSPTGADFILGTAPTVDSMGLPTKLTFDSTQSQYLKNVADIASFNTQSTGSVVYNANVVTVSRMMFTLQDLSDNLNFFRVGINSSDNALLTIRKNGGNNRTLTSTTTLLENDIVEWSSNGSVITLRINGVTDIVVGTNSGEWMDYPLTLDSSALGAIIRDSSDLYYDYALKNLIITSTPLTDAQSLAVANELNGVTTGYDISALSNILWLKASDLTTLTLDVDVTRLNDKSVTGADFIQSVPSAKPTIDNTVNPTSTTFLASASQVLSNTLDIASFNAQSTGSVISICDSLAGETRMKFALALSSSSTARFRCYFDSNDKYVLEIREDGGTNNSLISTTVCVDGDVAEWKLVNGSKKCFINGVEDTIIISSGTNGSQWMTIETFDIASVGAWLRSGSIYYNTIQRELIITSTPLTDAQSLNLANYLISKHS